MRRKVLAELSGLEDGAIQDPQERRSEVARDLIAISYRQGSFTTTTGLITDYHLDPALFMAKPTLLRRLGRLLAEHIGNEVDRVAGSEPGSVALAIAVALHTGLPYVSLRPEDTSVVGDGVCGELHPNEKVVLIEDVLSSGSRALQGARTIAKHKADLVAVLGVIDRGEGASEALSVAQIEYTSLYTMSDLAQKDGFARHLSPAAVEGGMDR